MKGNKLLLALAVTAAFSSVANATIIEKEGKIKSPTPASTATMATTTGTATSAQVNDPKVSSSKAKQKQSDNGFVSVYLEHKVIEYDYQTTENYGGGNVVDFSQDSEAALNIIGLAYTKRHNDMFFNVWAETSIDGDYETSKGQTTSVCSGKCKSTDSDYSSFGGDVMWKLNIDTNDHGTFYAGPSIKYYQYDTGTYKAGDVNHADELSFWSLSGMGVYSYATGRWVFDVSAEAGLGWADFETKGVDPVVGVSESRKLESTVLLFGADVGASYIITEGVALRGYTGFTASSELSTDSSAGVSFISNVTSDAKDSSFGDWHVGLNLYINQASLAKNF